MKKYIIISIIFIAMACTIGVLRNKNQKLKEDNQRLQTNIEYYSSFGSENIVLQHTVKELKESKDSLVQHINDIQKKLDLKPKETRTVFYNETVIRDTIRDTVPMTFNFEVTMRPNDLTAITVSRQDSMLTVIPDIRNSQTLFIQTEKRYKYKNFFSRLIHFNFGKVTTNRYYIDNSNDLIKVEDTRVIDVVD